MHRSLKYSLFLIILIILGCSKDSPEEPNPGNSIENPDTSENPSNPDVSDDLMEVTGSIDLGENLKGENLRITTQAGEYQVDDNGAFIAGVPESEKNVLFVENNNGELLYASFIKEVEQNINATTTAEVLFGMMPWSANTSFSDLQNILDELNGSIPFNELVEAIDESVNNKKSPLTNPSVLSEFEDLLAISDVNEQAAMRIPEVDYTVEPKITYQGTKLHVNNDGTTTAAWGLEVLDYTDNTSLTENLILVGNEVSFPSLESLWNFFWNDSTAVSMVFKKSQDLEIPVSVEGKYRMKFGGPMRGTSSLSTDAAFYNFFTSINDVFTAFGVMHDDYVPDVESCFSIFDGLIDVYIDALKADELSPRFFFLQLYEFSKSSLLELTQCSEFFEGMPNSVMSNKEKYLGQCLKFLDAYSKLETSFKLGKKFGDMALLNNMNICRQVIDGDIYPCFTLVKNPDIDGTTLIKNERFKLEVSTKLDIEPEEEVFPVGAKIHWEVVEGDGTLQSKTTNVRADGIADVWFTAGEEEVEVVTASLIGKNQNVIEKIEYEINKQPSLVGNWLLTFECEDCGQTTATITLNSDNTITFPGNLNENVTENSYTFDGENLSIRHKRNYLTCDDEITVSATTEMYFELVSENNFEGTYKWWDTGGMSDNCIHYSSQVSYNATLTRQNY